MRIQVHSGDIAIVRADALITTINSKGLWFGGIDQVIKRAAGEMFHDQAIQRMPLHDGDTVIASANGTHKGEFSNVVFVVDDLQQPVCNIIKAGLKAANDAGLKTVTLPPIRMGVLTIGLPEIRMGIMLGAVEKTNDEALSGLLRGLLEFRAANQGTCIQSATFVVDNDLL